VPSSISRLESIHQQVEEATSVEMKEKKARVEDALHATPSRR